jgi:hypothetical protein
MSGPIIETPRGTVTIQGGVTARLDWNPDFQPRWQNNYSMAQKFVDNAVLAGCNPYIPLITGMLIASGILGTTVGSGECSWIAPYARAVYYSKRAVGRESGALRGGFWFARWKPIGAPSVIAGARKIAGGG